jgi:hypothetical protein
MPIHPKVIAATLGALVPSLALAILTWAQSNPDVLTDHVPKVWAGLLVLLIPTLITFVAGYAKVGPQPTALAMPPTGGDGFKPGRATGNVIVRGGATPLGGDRPAPTVGPDTPSGGSSGGSRADREFGA